MALAMISTTISSGTSSPASMYRPSLLPSSEPLARSARKTSPLDRCTMPNCSASLLAWVPLPAPGGPISTILIDRPP